MNACWRHVAASDLDNLLLRHVTSNGSSANGRDQSSAICDALPQNFSINRTSIAEGSSKELSVQLLLESEDKSLQVTRILYRAQIGQGVNEQSITKNKKKQLHPLTLVRMLKTATALRMSYQIPMSCARLAKGRRHCVTILNASRRISIMLLIKANNGARGIADTKIVTKPN